MTGGSIAGLHSRSRQPPPAFNSVAALLHPTMDGCKSYYVFYFLLSKVKFKGCMKVHMIQHIVADVIIKIFVLITNCTYTM